MWSFTHDMARYRAYRWGEDGLLGWTDRQCRLCFSTSLWNGKDPILKERLFGLTNPEGNHGEDVKELYYYLDATPTHSYCQGALQIPAGRLSLRRPRPNQPRPWLRPERVRTPGHGRPGRGALLRRRDRIRQGGRRGHADPHHGDEPRAGGGGPRRAADADAAQQLVLAQPRARDRNAALDDASGRHDRGREPRRSGPLPLPRGLRRCAAAGRDLYRERHQHPPAGLRLRGGPGLHQGRVRPLSGPWRRRGRQPRAEGHQGRLRAPA